MESEYNWVNRLKVGTAFKVYDNSYCYKLDGDKDERVLLNPSNCDVDGENPYQLIIEKIVEEEIGEGLFRHKYPVVYLKSSVTDNRYKVGICWNEECARLNRNIK